MGDVIHSSEVIFSCVIFKYDVCSHDNISKFYVTQRLFLLSVCRVVLYPVRILVNSEGGSESVYF
jgi:hypothetical protein